MQDVYISGTGSFLPERVLSNRDLEGMVDTSDEWIVQRTGIRERRVVAQGQNTADLAAGAGRRALEASGMAPGELDAIILATVTPDTYCPAGAAHVQRILGASRAFAFDISAACTGFIYGTAIAQSLIRSGMGESILVIGAESLSRVVDYSDRGTCILFGDGAGAAVLRRAPLPEGGGESGTPAPDRSRIVDSQLRTDGTGSDLIEIPAGGSRLPASAETVAGKQHSLRMKGKEVFKFATRAMVELIETACSRNRITLADLALIIPHQVNHRIIEAAQSKLSIPPEKLFLNLERYGNTSAASIPIALDEAVRGGRVRRGDLILLVAFGAGLTWGYNVIRW